MATKKHRLLVGDDSHLTKGSEYANAAALTAGDAWSANANNVGKLARQLDTGEYFELTAVTPTWKAAAGQPLAATRSPTFAGATVTNGANGSVACTDAASFFAARVNPATVGSYRCANNSGVFARNAANTANIRNVQVDASDQLMIGENTAANVIYDVTAAGAHKVNVNGATCLTIDATKTTAAALKVSSLSTGIAHVGASGDVTSSTIVNADVDPAAAIVSTKLAAAVQTSLGKADTAIQVASLSTLAGGDGSDGALAPTTVITLTKPTNYSTLTYAAGGQIRCNGFPLSVQVCDARGAVADWITRLAVNGNAGNAAGTGGAAATTQQAVGDPLPGCNQASLVGGAGGTAAGTGAAAANNNATVAFGIGGAASAGGTGSGGAGGAGGTAGTQTRVGVRIGNPLFSSMTCCLSAGNATTQMYTASTPGRSGGGGGGDGTAGGGGGSGGLGNGMLWCSFGELITDGSTAAGFISSKGGTGGNGGTPGAGNRGGGGAAGGGGGGGICCTVGKRTGATVANGVDASGGPGGLGGSGTGTGTGSAGGTGGESGYVAVYNLQTGVPTSAISAVAGSAGSAAVGTVGGAGGAGGQSKVSI